MPESVVAKIAGEIQARMTDLEPYLREYRRLQEAADLLAPFDGATSVPRAPARRRRNSRRGRSTASIRHVAPEVRTAQRVSPKRGRPSVRRQEVLEAIQGQPGIRISQLAGSLQLRQSYASKLAHQLASEGLVVKRGWLWHPASA